MNVDSLYWALSTLPQVSAALVAFIGFLALQSILEISERCKSREEKSRDYVLQNRHHLTAGKLANRSPGQIQTMRGVTLMEAIEEDLKEADPQSNTVQTLKSHVDLWAPLHNWRQRAYRVLAAFIVWNFFLMLISLALLPFALPLRGVGGLELAWLIACASIVVSAGIMVYEALFRPRP